ncbi:MAG: helix-turn-helix domain-containing protein [Oscillospiraceae bacterium]|nr:helix-turn-helix domain-containing protein [Oscillospiraceae bacterium]
MNFIELLAAVKNNPASAGRLIEMYRPMLTKAAIVDGVFDEDLHQELVIVLLRCVRSFKI